MNSLFGAIAGVNQWLGTVRVNAVPLNAWLMIFLPLVDLFAWFSARSDGSNRTWAALALSVLIQVLLLQSLLRHDIVFGRDAGMHDFDPQFDAEAATIPGFLASGRFILWEGDRTRWERFFDRMMSGTRGDRWFLEVPATFDIRDEHRFSIAALLDTSQRFMGIRLEDKAGIWTVDGQFGTLDRPELGALHLGLMRTRPAIRLQFQNPKGRCRKVVLTFDDERKRVEFLKYLQMSSGSNWRGLY